MGGIAHSDIARLVHSLADSFDAPEISSLLVDGHVTVDIHLDTQDVATLLRLVNGEAIQQVQQYVYQPIPTYPPFADRGQVVRPWGPIWISKTGNTTRPSLDIDHNTKENKP